MPDDRWSGAKAYDAYIGRWSRLVSPLFLDWLGVPAGRRWLDVGCGTGALVGTVLAAAHPASVVGVDPSAAFVAQARAGHPVATFHVGDALALPLPDDSVDVAAAALVLNFVPDPVAAVTEMRRVGSPDATIAAYVWDYAEGMQLIQRFWAAAADLDPAAAELDEAHRFPLCRPGGLDEVFAAAGLTGIESRAIEVSTVFADFDDYWRPFLGGTAPGPAYCATLSDGDRFRLRERLRSTLPAAPDGTIALTARAWAAKATAPGR